MFGYLNEYHINEKDYPYKQYMDAYDHDNKKGYTYNWISVQGLETAIAEQHANEQKKGW